MIYVAMRVVAIAIPCAWVVVFIRALFRPAGERAQAVHDRLLIVRAARYLRDSKIARQNPAVRGLALLAATGAAVGVYMMIYAASGPRALHPGAGGDATIVVYELLTTVVASYLHARELKRRAKKEVVEELRARPATIAGSQISSRLED